MVELLVLYILTTNLIITTTGSGGGGGGYSDGVTGGTGNRQTGTGGPV